MSNNPIFSDIQNHWAQECIRQLYARTIVSGYSDGTFRPNASVTRAEFAALLNKAFPNLPVVRDAIAFTDVPSTYWAYPVIQSAYRKGLLSGFPDRTFKPNDPILRVQVLLALVSGLKYTPSTTPNEIVKKYYDDAATIPSYAVGAIATATENRIVVNYPNIRRFNPNQSATRAEVAAFICRALKLPGVPLQYVPGMEFVVIQPQFEQADEFSEGLARVKTGDKWGYIDTKGKFAIQPQLDEANSFSEGLALVRNYLSVGSSSVESSGETPTEIRGVWLANVASKVFNSRQNIAEAMNFLAQTGFNVVFPVVWNNSTTLSPSRVMRDTFGVEIDPRYAGRDPLAELIAEAKRVGLAVIPWFEYGFASSFGQNGGPLLTKKPQWAARDFNGNLLQKNSFFWLNAFDSEVQEFMRGLVLEVAKNYDVAGIQGDDRMPALPSEGSYDPKTVQRYVQQFNANPPQNSKDAQWLQWRADILTDFLTRLYRDVIAINPNLIVSVSPSVYPWALQEYLQDSQAWVDQGQLDMIHPQVYYRDFDGYKQTIDRVVAQQFSSLQLPSLAPGVLIKVGSYRITPELLLQKIQYNRDRGIPGEVFFFYEGLREDNDALAKALRSGPYAKPAPFNISKIKQRSFTSRRISGKYSYIDKLGKAISQLQFDWADSFKESFAKVKMGYKWGYIDKNGNLISRFQFDEAELFAEGLALVKIGSKYGYIDRTGKFVIPLQYDEAKSFKEGLASVKLNNVWGYISQTGQAIILPQFDEADSFSQGLAKIKLSGKYGYIDKTGQAMIQPQFDEAGAFSDGLAQVKLGDKWGYINPTGQPVITPQFKNAQSFTEGLAAVKIDDRWGYINKTGKLVIPLEFDDAQPFDEGLARVSLGGKWGYARNALSSG
jgi:uncharacterized lipoprotein YddW (UPF0748 family)